MQRLRSPALSSQQKKRDKKQIRIEQMLHTKPQMQKQRRTETEEPPWNDQLENY